MSEFQNSDLADNTIIVFTADHASYVDMGWNQAFPDYERAFGSLDRVPFFIYYKGVKPQKVDAQGRNSLDMAPTLLDYLDVSAPNYFLGSSLFLQKDPSRYLETTFWQEGIIRSTASGQIETMSQADQDKVTATLQEYFAAKGTTSGGSGSNDD
jgi:arylsulfatase A-like enzyme